MQSEGKKAPGEPKKYANAFKAYGIIARWAGLRVNAALRHTVHTILGHRTHRAHLELVVVVEARVLPECGCVLSVQYSGSPRQEIGY